MTARPSCHGPCLQGHVDCPTPDACLLPDDDYTAASWLGVWLGVTLVVVCYVVALSIGGLT